jgi:hypothetical protein
MIQLIKMLCGMVVLTMVFVYSFAAPMQKKIEISKVLYSQKSGATRSMSMGLTGNAGYSKDVTWGKIEVDYTNSVEWADEVEVKLYALLESSKQEKNEGYAREQKASPYTMLTGNVTYVNVPQGKENKAVLFIHPYALKRYGELKQIHVEVSYKGVVVSKMDQSFLSTKEKRDVNLKDWWTRVSPVPGQILPHTRTPFMFDLDNPLTLIKST